MDVAAGYARCIMSRTIISADPFLNTTQYKFGETPWPARWVGPLSFDAGRSAAVAYRLRFDVAEERAVRIHVSADQRYELFLDGKRIGRGCERGDLRNWFYETYDLRLSAGRHTLAARCWWLSPYGLAPEAQQTVRPAFLLYGEGEAHALMSTGAAAWQMRPLGGYSFAYPHRMASYVATGARITTEHAALPWRPEIETSDEGWGEATAIEQVALAAQRWESQPFWMLRPALLPPMHEAAAPAPDVRYVAPMASMESWKEPVQLAPNLTGECAAWAALLKRAAAVQVPPHTTRRILLDLGDYRCFYPEIRTSGGEGARLSITSAESLFHNDSRDGEPRHSRKKGNRDEIDGKHFFGIGDNHVIGGGECLCDAHWWLAGRYVEVCIQTAEQPLTVNSMVLLETRYPYEFTAEFESADARLAAVMPVALRTLNMCSHETSMDCPFYEQLNYVGDTRLQSLVAMSTSSDDRLVRKCIELFDISRMPDGFTMSRYPTRTVQTIPPFSLWWVMLVHDYAMYRNDPAFVAARMPGVRAVMERWRQQVRRDGRVESPRGWNFVDWVPAWPKGMPPGAEHGHSGILQWQLALASSAAAALERQAGESTLAQRHEEMGWQLAQGAQDHYWDTEQMLFADDGSHSAFSQHAQCLAILSGMIPESQAQLVMREMIKRQDLAVTTIYFTHYLFEACRRTGQIDYLLKRLQPWFGLRSGGFKTTFEAPEPSRSDCHAWGAHPVFHYYGTLLGIRPAAPGFKRVRIQPQLGELEWAKGTMPHPAGTIAVSVERHDGRLVCEVTLPRGVEGELIANEHRTHLRAGRQVVGRQASAGVPARV